MQIPLELTGFMHRFIIKCDQIFIQVTMKDKQFNNNYNLFIQRNHHLVEK